MPIVLSPPLLLAGLHSLRAMSGQSQAAALRLRYAGPGAADVEFVHRLLRAAHQEPVVQASRWPFVRGLSAERYRALAMRYGVERQVPEVGDVMVASVTDARWPSLVTVVSRVLERGSPPNVGPTFCELVSTEPEPGVRGWMRLMTIRRWCGPSRGDVVVAWADLPTNCELEEAA